MRQISVRAGHGDGLYWSEHNMREYHAAYICKGRVFGTAFAGLGKHPVILYPNRCFLIGRFGSAVRPFQKCDHGRRGTCASKFYVKSPSGTSQWYAQVVLCRAIYI